MHPYTIDKEIRKKVIINIFILSIILSFFLTCLLGGFITCVKEYLQKFSLINDIFIICDNLGVTTNFIGIPFLYTIIYKLFDERLWKIKLLKKILNVPDLNGHWKGTLKSYTYKKQIEMDLEIKQTWSKISFTSKFEDSNSDSNVASVFTERSGCVEIGFGFINDSKQFPHKYDGYNILRIENDTHISGRYFNNRDNTNAGYSGGNIGNFELDKIIN